MHPVSYSGPTDNPFSLLQILKKAWFERAKVGLQPQVGIPLVKNGLAGYKTSILSYGQVIHRILLESDGCVKEITLPYNMFLL
jgi:hypothetical protein